MIDFSKITKTVGGLDCYYVGQRTSGGQVLHRFAVVNDAAELICYYNEQGQRIEYLGPGVWVVQNDGHQIIAPPKIVEVTRWVALYSGKTIGDGHFVCCYEKKPELQKDTLDIKQHTFRFEVPNE